MSLSDWLTLAAWCAPLYLLLAWWLFDSIAHFLEGAASFLRPEWLWGLGGHYEPAGTHWRFAFWLLACVAGICAVAFLLRQLN
ncbi:hypothetical protein N8I74_14595 [Chitiniphilus purpureus]|uniref:Uncharacterized protein n=1 Tax=Chitiniphilus purpureus TaxID=2981137 RepID=A0ABY6DJX1_9NEIS|nr:hypothetical protein [Chitiniphilus sp. CD1]UXY14538.1 hypothetical protein N8I74_14595 [Chitiniphilus sp. CD1]